MKSTLRFALALLVAGTQSLAGEVRAQSPGTERVSVATGGAEANADSSPGSISSNGRFVAFTSDASNLVSTDTNASSDVFVRDRRNGTTERVSIGAAGAEADFGSFGCSMSADARFVVFSSFATNLIAGDTNGAPDVFVCDRQTGTVERVSVSTSGAQATGSSGMATISDDGRFVAFQSTALNLAPGAWNAATHVYLRDRQSATTQLLSPLWGNSPYRFPQISANGRFVAFEAGPNVVVRDVQSGAVELINVSTSGVLSNNFAGLAAISADGRYVTFNSFATNLVAGQPNFVYDGYVRDRVLGTTERVTVGPTGSVLDADSWVGSISDDGRVVSFVSYATNLVPADTNAMPDLFSRDLVSGAIERMSVAVNGAEANSDSWGSFSSHDGRFAIWWSPATNFVPGDTNGCWDVFVRDCWAVPPRVYCTASTSSNGCSASISADAAPSVTFANPCHIRVTNVEGQKSGIVFYGIDNVSFSPSPWASGSTSWLCVKHPTQRTPIQNSGGTFGACDGAFVLDWNAYQATHPLALGNPWSVGDKVYVQAWFRDPFAVKATNLSDALELTYLP